MATLLKTRLSKHQAVAGAAIPSWLPGSKQNQHSGHTQTIVVLASMGKSCPPTVVQQYFIFFGPSGTRRGQPAFDIDATLVTRASATWRHPRHSMPLPSSAAISRLCCAGMLLFVPSAGHGRGKLQRPLRFLVLPIESVMKEADYFHPLEPML